MHCPFCRHPDSRVVDSRETDEGQAIRRRRSCPECGRRFSTVETAVLAVVKRSGVTEPFSREKVMRGVRRACQGRQVDDDALSMLAQQVEDAVRAAGSPEVPSNEVGLAILGPLRELDEVAYLRFASVYRQLTERPARLMTTSAPSRSPDQLAIASKSHRALGQGKDRSDRLNTSTWCPSLANVRARRVPTCPEPPARTTFISTNSAEWQPGCR